jgi:hypothetical protein
VAVQRVVTGVQLAADEPAVERGPRVIEDLLRLDVPVDELRRFDPEAFRVADASPVDLVVADLSRP